MVSKKTNGSTEARTISERLNQGAYSYYSSTAVVHSGDRSTAAGLKRFFAAALLSSSSIMVLSSPASALGPAACNPVMPANGTTVNCTGVTTSSQDFTGDNLTIIADENFNQDTSGNTIGAQRVNAGIFITGSGGTIQHSGTIKTGEIPEGMGTYGRHNGLYIIGGTGNVSAENTATGSITTTAVDSAGIQVSATTGTSTAINRGTINTSGENSDGIYSSNYATSIATNTGSITVTGDGSRGIVTNGNTTTVNNTGTVSATGSGTYGVHASSFSVATTNVTNSGTITQSGAAGMTRFGAAAIFATGPTVNVTNTSTGTITGTDVALRIGYGNTVTIVNDGTMNGDVNAARRGPGRIKAVSTLSLTNSGTINGQVVTDGSFAASITNNGGTIGDGTYATHTGAQDDVVTITGSGNVINGAFRDDGGTGVGNNVINFNQSDILTLNGASRGYAFFGFETANFNSGTTVIAQERGIGTNRYMGTSQVNINAGATLSTSSMNLGINTNQLTVSGRGTTRGTLHAPAGSNIVVTGGDTTFNAGGRFRVGVASDTSAGYLNGGSGTVTFNAG
ncbi:MAG: hypothetical protein HEP70_19815, partial [Rhodobiaceae bacterium]|nr:hypothetical protein [Rhodobiaceae bacterium]